MSAIETLRLFVCVMKNVVTISARCLPVCLLTGLLSACASTGAQYSPQVDNSDLANYQTDLDSCQTQAKNIESNSTESSAIGALLGAAAGSTDSAEATIAGAAIGAIVGAVSGNYLTKKAQKEEIIRCMQAKGYNVIDANKNG